MQRRFFGLENICLQLETEAKGDLEIALDNGLLITLWGCTCLYSPYKEVQPPPPPLNPVSNALAGSNIGEW